MNDITLRVWFPLFLVCNHLHHPVHPVHAQSLVLVQFNDLISTTSYHQHLATVTEYLFHSKIMTENLSHCITPGSPKAPLSITDALPIIFNQLEAEREHTNVKLTRIVESNRHTFNSLISEISTLRESCKNTDFHQISRRVTYLESALSNIGSELKTNVEILEESIANISLKSETSSMYLQLLFNLKKGLFKTLSCITQDKCCPCKSKSGLPHSPADNNQDKPYCSQCDKTFYPTKLFTHHMATQHQSQVYSCSLCELTCTNSEILDHHLRTHHRILHAAKCPVCCHVFMNNADLQSHMSSTHAVLCAVCGKLLQSESDIHVHMTTDHADMPGDTGHNVELEEENNLPSVACDQTVFEFPTTDLSFHIQAHNSYSPPLPEPTTAPPPGNELDPINNTNLYTCDNCEDTFESFDDLTDHIGSIHAQELCYPCEDCKIIFESLSTLEMHFATHHDTIPQVDGPIEEVPDLVPQGCVSTRTANYVFNKKKQIKEITKDAMLVDFEATVNNNDENCTIKCSSGFYLQVAKASFLTLDDTSTFTLGNVAIKISDVKITNDETGSEANRLIKFTFFTKSISCGSVAVHLHHSTRTIQVQGSAIMPDSTKAAFWFVSKIILKRFQDLAKAKQYAIKNFNSLVRDFKPTSNYQHTKDSSSNISHSLNSCQHCLSRFAASARPSVCPHCGKYFHKRNCLKEHMKACINPTQPTVTNSTTNSIQTPVEQLEFTEGDQVLTNLTRIVSIPGLSATATSFIPQSQPITTTTMAISTASIPSFSSTSTTAPIMSARPSSSHSEPVVSIPGLKTAVTFIPETSAAAALFSMPSSTATIASSTPVSKSSVIPSAPPSTSTVSSPTVNLPQNTASGSTLNLSLPKPTTKPSSRKGKGKAVPTSNEDITAEFLKRELAAAQARIAQLDITVNDKEQKITILMARVNSLEEAANKDVYDRYFPKVQPNSDQPQPGGYSLPSSHQHCYIPSSCCNHSTQCCQARLPCPPAHHHTQHQHSYHRCDPQSSPVSDNVAELVLKLEKMINEVKNKIDAVEILQRNTVIAPNPTESTQHYSSPKTMSAELSQESNLEESMTSVEIDIPENPLETLPLNSQNLTIQLQ